jgi:hypothetical protein
MTENMRRSRPLPPRPTQRPGSGFPVRNSLVAPDNPGLVSLVLIPQVVVCGAGPTIPALFAASGSTTSTLVFVIGASLGVAAAVVGLAGLFATVYLNGSLWIRLWRPTPPVWKPSWHRFGVIMLCVSTVLLLASVVTLLCGAFLGAAQSGG